MLNIKYEQIWKLRDNLIFEAKFTLRTVRIKKTIVTLFQEYAKYRSRIGAKETYRILLTVSVADPIAKIKYALDLCVINISNWSLISKYNFVD